MATKTEALSDLLELNIRINVVKSLYSDNPIGKDFAELFENIVEDIIGGSMADNLAQAIESSL